MTRRRQTLAEARAAGGAEAVRALVVEAVARLRAGETLGDVAESYGTHAPSLRRAAERVEVPWPQLPAGAPRGSIGARRAAAARRRRA